MKVLLPPNVAPPAGRRSPAELLALRKYASTWRCTTVRQPLCDAAGLIHADSVIALDRFSDAELATRTRLLLPLKLSALPKRPWLVQEAPVIVPPLPLPVASAVVVPMPSPNAHAPTSPGGVGG